MTVSRIDSHRSGKTFELASTLQSATQCVDTLLALITDEREALSTGNIEAIEECGRNKATSVVELETLDSRRAQLCRDLNLDNGEIDNYLHQQQRIRTPNLWADFLVKLEQCREANAVNGSFARIRRGHIEKALQILRGSPETPELYGPNGHEDANNVTQLGRA